MLLKNSYKTYNYLYTYVKMYMWYGKIIKEVNTFYTSSQICNICGYKNIIVKNLKIRLWKCPNCRTLHDRDYNTSINILNEGLLTVYITYK